MCRSYNLNLLTLADTTEQNYILAEIRNINYIRQTPLIHIGGVRDRNGKRAPFYWENDDHFPISENLRWGKGE
jgi:hypothetical protein